MRAVVVLGGAAAVGLVVGRRRRRRHAAEEAPAPHADPLAIEASDDPDDILNRLQDDHDRLTEMVRDVRALPTDGKAFEERARHAMQRLVIVAVQHEAVEDDVFWPAVRDRVEGGHELAATADAQQIELRRLLQSLDRSRPSDPGWGELLAEVGRASYEHQVWEQTRVWPAFSRAVDARARAELGRRLEAARATAPTRPHVSHSASKADHPLLGKAVATLDRIEDSVAHRG